MRVRGRELCKVAPEQVRGDNAISTVSGSFAATAAQDDATGSVYGDPGTGAGVTCSRDRHWTLSPGSEAGAKGKNRLRSFISAPG